MRIPGPRKGTHISGHWGFLMERVSPVVLMCYCPILLLYYGAIVAIFTIGAIVAIVLSLLTASVATRIRTLATGGVVAVGERKPKWAPHRSLGRDP